MLQYYFGRSESTNKYLSKNVKVSDSIKSYSVTINVLKYQEVFKLYIYL